MTLQTSYTRITKQLGMAATGIPQTVISRAIELASVPFGALVVRGASDNTVRLPAVGQINYVGFALMDQAQPATVADGYAVGATAAIITKGDIVVTAGEAVADGDPVYFVPGTGALMKTASGNVLVPNAVWDTTAASGALAVIRLG